MPTFSDATATPDRTIPSLAWMPRVVPPHRAPPERELPLAAYLAVSEFRVLRGRRPLPGNLAYRAWFWLALAAAAAAFSVLRNLT